MPFVPILDSFGKAEIENKLNPILQSEVDMSKGPKEIFANINKLSAPDKKRFADEGLLFDQHPSIESIIPYAKWAEGCSILSK